MANAKKIWQEGYKRLKKAVEKLGQAKKQTQPQLVLQPIPVRNLPDRQTRR